MTNEGVSFLSLQEICSGWRLKGEHEHIATEWEVGFLLYVASRRGTVGRWGGLGAGVVGPGRVDLRISGGNLI